MMSTQQQSHGGVCGANDMCLLIFDDEDGEFITVVDENKDADNSVATKKISLLNKFKKNHRRSTANIIRTDHPSSGAAKMSTSLPTINESRNDLEEGLMIPDDISESSFNVLKRYMGCSPIPYGTSRSTLVTTRDRDGSDIRVCAPSNEAVKEDIKSTQPPLTSVIGETRNDKEDDTSKSSSLDVLLRYIGCTPISYCDHKQHSTTIISSQVDEISRNEISINPSHIYGSCEIDDSNSLLPDNDEEEESIDDVTPEQRHELLIEVIKEMIAGSKEQEKKITKEKCLIVDTNKREEKEMREDQIKEDKEMKSIQGMSSPRRCYSSVYLKRGDSDIELNKRTRIYSLQSTLHPKLACNV